MPDRQRSALQHLAWPSYFVALILIVLPLVDLITNVWPVRLSALEWRYGTLGLLSAFTLTPLLGIVLAVASAAVLDHRVVQRILGIMNLLAAVALLVVVVLFALDWLQMRPSVEPDPRRSMDMGAVKALAKHALVAVALGWLGIAGLRATRRERGDRGGRTRTPLIRERQAGAET